MRDHRDEHPGCKVFWPWLRWCSNYRYASQLVQMCLDDIQTMEPKLFSDIFQNCKRYDDVTKRRSGARSAYIAHREKWSEDYESKREEVQRLYKYIPLGDSFYEGRNLDEQVEYEWFRGQQIKAVQVLYAYNMFNKKTGQVNLDNLKKLK
jgi:hypothetical protein